MIAGSLASLTLQLREVRTLVLCMLLLGLMFLVMMGLWLGMLVPGRPGDIEPSAEKNSSMCGFSGCA